jgi:menaquinone-dependent protoporphyrinogen oxidase
VKNVLVAYASKRGSTAEIAEAIAEELRECGLVVDCVPADQVATVEPYDAVVLGSAVYIKHWRGDARRFLRHNADGLSRRSFWVFSSGPVGEGSDEIEQGWVEPPRIVERVEALGVREHVVFGGRVPTPPKNRLERALVERTTPKYRDCRDWREIRAWARAIGAALGARHREAVVR